MLCSATPQRRKARLRTGPAPPRPPPGRTLPEPQYGGAPKGSPPWGGGRLGVARPSVAPRLLPSAPQDPPRPAPPSVHPAAASGSSRPPSGGPRDVPRTPPKVGVNPGNTPDFLTVLASVAGMILACANSLAHDVFAARAREMTPRREMLLARLSAAVVGVPAILLATLVQHRSLHPLITLPFCLGASAIAPALVHSLFWRRYTRTGLLAALIGGTVSVLLLMPGTTLVSGSPVAAFPDADFTWFPFTTTGLLSIPSASPAAGSAPSPPAAPGRRNSAASTRRWRAGSSPARPAEGHDRRRALVSASARPAVRVGHSTARPVSALRLAQTWSICVCTSSRRSACSRSTRPVSRSMPSTRACASASTSAARSRASSAHRRAASSASANACRASASSFSARSSASACRASSSAARSASSRAASSSRSACAPASSASSSEVRSRTRRISASASVRRSFTSSRASIRISSALSRAAASRSRAYSSATARSAAPYARAASSTSAASSRARSTRSCACCRADSRTAVASSSASRNSRRGPSPSDSYVCSGSPAARTRSPSSSSSISRASTVSRAARSQAASRSSDSASTYAITCNGRYPRPRRTISNPRDDTDALLLILEPLPPTDTKPSTTTEHKRDESRTS
ncbi:transmembrane transport protein [Streptomyces gancidicus BKS 13-15]|uniref:Transmembrane transport protein n=1 Tax=Streptomyces gancidicus BKS 13-15 TaxID=1284664 RepID=M3DSH9_STREZ|nr:transmembrane transport protein [Streptomyces gancidicus BKS 13-15]